MTVFGPQKLHLWCRNKNSKTIFIVQTFPRYIEPLGFFREFITFRHNFGQILKGWLAIAKLKPLVERYSCQPMRRPDTSNNLSVGPSCMSKTRRERESRGGTLQGSRETTFSSDSSDWCRIKIVKTIFFCGLRVIYR